MTRRRIGPLRPLTIEEREYPVRTSRTGRGQAEPAGRVARAKALLAAAEGHSYTESAGAAGRKSGGAVSRLVSRSDRAGVAALGPGRGGGPSPTYAPAERGRIPAGVRRTPDREADGTAARSLSTLKRSLREAPDGLPTVSTPTIRGVLRGSGYSRQRDRGWCDTGAVVRERKGGPVEVTDPDAAPEKA